MLNDTRKEQLSVRALAMTLLGLYVVPRKAAQAFNDLAVRVTPGIATIDGHVQQHKGDDELAIFAGPGLNASSEVISHVVTYFNPAINAIALLVVDGVQALTADGAVAPDDAAIIAALPDPAYPFTVNGTVKFVRDAGFAITLEYIDHSTRSFDVPVGSKHVADVSKDRDVVGADAEFYEPWGTLSHTMDAPDLSDADALTDLPLPPIWGRIRGWRAVDEVAITTGGKTTTPHLEINAAAVTGTDGAPIAGAIAKGVVVPLGAPTADNKFGPGDAVSIVCAATTPFIEGRVRFEIDIDRLVTAPGC